MSFLGQVKIYFYCSWHFYTMTKSWIAHLKMNPMEEKSEKKKKCYQLTRKHTVSGKSNTKSTVKAERMNM